MHGRVKVRTTAEQEEIKKKERAVKVAQYKADMAIVFQKRKEKKWDDELLLVTKRMLLNNSDIYTLWNIRREIFEYNKWSEEDYKQLLENEMSLTEQCLRDNPKSYSVWHQRSWVMERMSEPDWKKELSLCDKCLNLDERNFHCWDYREFVVQKARISNEEEFKFSTIKILNNFSNYSSWHYRSRILTKMFEYEQFTEFENMPIDRYEEELDLVMNATFTDPYDTSAWFYQRWLLDRCLAPPWLWRAKITEDEAVVVIDTILLIKSVSLSLYVNGKTVDTQWQLYPDEKFAKLRIAKFTSPLDLNNATIVSILLQGSLFTLSYSKSENAWIYRDITSLHKQNSNDKQLSEQLKSYNQLAVMEPKNKWVLLTGILLMKKIDFKKYYVDILNNLSTLPKIDSLRKCYFEDLRSILLVEYKLLEIWKEESCLEIQSKIDLSGLDLTKLHNNHYFSFFEEVNLDANRLIHSLYQLSTLQQCKELSLSSNGLTSLKQFPILHNLKVLSLRNNELVSTKEILDLIKWHKNLIRLDLRDNPVCGQIDTAKIQEISPNIEIRLK